MHTTPTQTCSLSSFPLFTRWVSGFLLSFLCIWGISQYFSTTLYNWSWDETLQEYVIAPRTIHRHRKEGWATTHVGQHGIYAIPDIEQVKHPKVIFWGDSFVQGFQVNDQDKMAQQFTRLWQNSKQNDLVGVGIGTGDMDCADYYYLIPKYEKIMTSIICHVIVLHDMNDTFPDRSTTRYRFVSSPRFQLLADDPSPPIRNPGLIDMAKFFRMDAFFRLLYDAKSHVQNLRFRVGPKPLKTPSLLHENQKDKSFYEQAWKFFIPELKKQTTHPILIAYCPAVPSLQKGKIHFDDPQADLFQSFRRMCEEEGIKTIDITPRLLQHFQTTHRFTRGFFNANPLEGHFNSEGHRLVAEAVCRSLTSFGGEIKYAIYPG